MLVVKEQVGHLAKVLASDAPVHSGRTCYCGGKTGRSIEQRAGGGPGLLACGAKRGARLEGG